MGPLGPSDPAGCPALQLGSDTVHLEVAPGLTAWDSAPRPCSPPQMSTSGFSLYESTRGPGPLLGFRSARAAHRTPALHLLTLQGTVKGYRLGTAGWRLRKPGVGALLGGGLMAQPVRWGQPSAHLPLPEVRMTPTALTFSHVVNCPGQQSPAVGGREASQVTSATQTWVWLEGLVTERQGAAVALVAQEAPAHAQSQCRV